MAETKIQWANFTFNPWRGCQKVSPGCANCYAETWSVRQPAIFGTWGPNGTRVIANDDYWKEPIRWNRDAAKKGIRRRVFCASLADVFEERPELIEPRMRLFQLIGATPHLDWLLLTKRPETAREHWPLFAGYWASGKPEEEILDVAVSRFVIPNVWLGTSVEDQPRFDERIGPLLATPARIHFLSVEPLLSSIDLGLGRIWCRVCQRFESTICMDEVSTCFRGQAALSDLIDWVILGGESGPHARPCDVRWMSDLVGQCESHGVPVFVKQLGANPESYGTVAWPDSTRVQERDGMISIALNDKKGGDMEEFPVELRVRQFPSQEHSWATVNRL